jgi:Uma2 family endonuclease
VDLPQRKSFSPDASFHVGPPPGPRFLEGAPVFAAEVGSEDDYGPAAEKAMAAKRADYFAAGTQVVWDVDVLREGLIRVYRATAPVARTVYRRGEQAEAVPALPGWSFSVDEIFE